MCVCHNSMRSELEIVHSTDFTNYHVIHTYGTHIHVYTHIYNIFCMRYIITIFGLIYNCVYLSYFITFIVEM